MLLYSVDLLTFVLFFLCLNYKNDNISLLALTNNIYFIGGESYGASIEHSFFNKKTGIISTFLSLILLVGGLLFALRI